MLTLYIFALVVGAGLLLFSLFGHSGDSDLHVGHDDTGSSPFEWLSLRTAIYFLFVFGGVGTVLTKTWHSATAPLILLLAAGAGLGVGAVVSATFAYLRRTGSGDRQSDESFVGVSGTMTVPFGPGGTGKVLVTRGDRTYELLAQAFDAGRSDAPSWKTVVVLEMQRGIAVVAPSDDPSTRELFSLNP
jgi:hypothetical protein